MDKNCVSVLGKGYVRYVDSMGTDHDIADSARVSFKNHNNGSKSQRKKDRQLIRYLISHGHWSPLQQCNIKFHIKAPIFVLRQFMRHHFAYNEISGRYTTIEDNDYYLPNIENLNKQSEDNKQGRSEQQVDNYNEVLSLLDDSSFDSFVDYKDLCERGLAKEIARIVLPLNTYSEIYVNMDLRTCLHMLRQRLDKHAQLEIREYAKVIKKFIEERFPIAYEAFFDYVIEGQTFSRMEMQCISKFIIDRKLQVSFMRSLGMTEREINEFIDMLIYKIGVNVNVTEEVIEEVRG